ncbi:MAG: PQQ-like beta-propeller repeat protein, partial [Armatimonadetes bacterium]|nr:PQQ-like beta-propeller repeat protein [Armatimonadota bacterium]
TLFDLVVKRDKYAMLDRGFVSCVDRQTGQLRWEYPDKPIQEATRFVNEVRIAGDRVGIAGMGILGVLKLADGKPDWLAESPRKDTTPFYYTLAGVTQDRLWSYRVKTRMVGKGIRMDPYRLELEGAPSEVQCYDLAGRGQPRWTTPIGAERRRPALNLALILSADGKSCFGASGGTVFAVDAETGAIRWQKTGIFPAHFAGGMVLGEGILFATGSDARLVALDPNSGEKLWDFTSPTGRPLCTPLAHDGLVYAGSLDGKLYALEGRTGRSAWTLETSSAICGQPVVQGRKLYFTTDDGSLTEFALP